MSPRQKARQNWATRDNRESNEGSIKTSLKSAHIKKITLRQTRHSQKPITVLIRVTFTVDKANIQYITKK